jgi:hypothetical protein
MRMPLKLMAAALLVSGAALLAARPVMAFCGFYVAKADAKLFNKASKVVVARKGELTAITMASDYEGDPKEFAIVVPVPTVVKKEQIAVVENAVVDHLDSYSAPRLVEYYDPDPCMVYERDRVYSAAPAAPMASKNGGSRRASLGVKIEAQYTVGEYDILILSAKESDGLSTWLTENGYKLPEAAASVLGSYIKQNMKFFVAKVNLAEKTKIGARYLRPIRVSYETNKFMVPIRLGTVNASGPQDMIVLGLSEKGRIETTNYRTAKIPSDVGIPLYTKGEFANFYRAMFDTQVARDDMRAVYLEYAWDMGWCDPCAADPLSPEELEKLGASWAAQKSAAPNAPGMMPRFAGSNVFVTRLHLRYDAEHFPEDLMFQETSDRSNFQGRYILRHPYTGAAQCEAARDYRRSLGLRYEQEAAALAHLTGWDIGSIREKMKAGGQKPE